MRITIPAVPDGLHPAGCWRRVITGLNPHKKGGFAVIGENVGAGDLVDVDENALILVVDKKTEGWRDGRRTNAYRQVPVQSVTVTVLRVTEHGLVTEWTKHFKQASSAFGATAMKKYASLIEQYPPSGRMEMVREARRPNKSGGDCRWCGKRIEKGNGHSIRDGEDWYGDPVYLVEHYEVCPPATLHQGDVCLGCGREIAAGQGHRHHQRDGDRWVALHETIPHDPDQRIRCAVETMPTPAEASAAEEQRRASAARRQAALAEERRAEKQRQEEREKRNRERRHAREARKREQIRAERERISMLSVVGVEKATELNDKGLGGGMRVSLTEELVLLSDGTHTTRWRVRTRGGGSFSAEGEGQEDDRARDDVFDEKGTAQWVYRGMKWQPDYQPRRRENGRECDNCGRNGATFERHDSSGIRGLVCAYCDAHNDDVMLSFA